jgi:hypothetical protein
MSERLRLVTFRVKCSVWNERDGAGPYNGFGFASDISPEGAGVFLERPFPKGTPVRIALEDDAQVPYSGMVAWCLRINLDQRFHAQANLEFRIGVQLLFATEAERQRYLMVYNDLRKRASSVPGQFKF